MGDAGRLDLSARIAGSLNAPDIRLRSLLAELGQ
jgi:hypothetical protein